MRVDWEAVRAEFPALGNWTYLNTATFGQLPRRATEAVARHFARRDEMACWDFLNWYDDMERVRQKAARLVHCQSDDIAFIANASTALGILLAGLDWRSGDRILTLEHEFPNNLYAPGLLHRLGVEMMECPWERFYDSVDLRTRLVCMSSVNYNTGFTPPLAEIAEFLRERGVLLYIDGTQSVGALQFDVGRIQPDMLAVHAYKWLISPNGAGFMYVRPELRERLRPNVLGWRSHRDWRNVDNLHHGVPELADSAEKYEGGSVTFAVIYAMEAAIDLILEIGPDVIEQRVLSLAEKTREIVRREGASVDLCGSPIVAARFENRDVSALARALKEQRVLVAARRGNLRVSPHFYNNEQDLETFAVALRKLH
ncbi:MAG TPA: aminotransferase class V-fold PLP-dependent enzyme [Bryobacteraceae bacterium]|jgi:selenocysteine lyase/cysteine desulfurase|nr:aminotransferase class V-fold PLP-dependent enzyme [Bryobacteraceae bacterium]